MIPKLVAHRGFMKHYPENSLTGIEMALEAGAYFVEFDIQMNASHEFIVIHDSNFQRTADRPENLFDLQTADTSEFSVHEPMRFDDKYFPTPVPTLTQVMELVACYPKAKAFVEIKDESLIQWGLDYVMDALYKALKPYASQSVIIGFNSNALRYVKQQGLYPIGWVVKSFDEAHHKKAEQLQPDYLIANYKKIIGDIGLWQGKWSWMLYDIADPDLALEWARNGSALIETCDIGTMLQHKELKKESCIHEL